MSSQATSVDILSVDDLVVRYGPIVAVQNVSLNVQQGEIVALLGANGAGKSSLLKAVVGLVPVAGGQVTFKGEPINKLTPEAIVRRGISLTPEGRRVFPRLTVADNLRLGGAVTRDRAAYDAAHEHVLEPLPDPGRADAARTPGRSRAVSSRCSPSAGR